MLVFFRVIQFIILYGGATYLAYIPFRDQFYLPKRQLIFCWITLLCLILMGYIGLLLFASTLGAQIWFLATMLICGVFYLYSIKVSSYKSVLVLLLVACYGAFVCGCAVFIANLIFDKGLGYETLYTIAALFIGGATYMIVYSFMADQIIPIMNVVSSNDLQSVYYMPLFYLILQVVFFVFYDTLGQINDLIYFIVLICVNVSTYFVVMDILHLLKSSVDRKQMQEEIVTTEKLLVLQKNQYASWIAQIEDIRRARHDLKHHMAMIQVFLDQEDKAGLQELVNNFQRALPESAPLILCKNMDVNAILVHYYERAQKEKVAFEIVADVGEGIAINSQDLAVVFGNCLENAFEACIRMDQATTRSVSLIAKPVGKGLVIIIDNTFDGELKQENEVFLSSKRDHEVGIGMASVKLIVRKYAGVASFEAQGNIFMTSIRLSGRGTDRKGQENNA